MLLKLQKLLLLGKGSVFKKESKAGGIFTNNPITYIIIHCKKKDEQISSLGSWICLLHYTSIYFPNSTKERVSMAQKEKIDIFLPSKDILFGADATSMRITGSSQIFLSLYKSDSNPKYDLPKGELVAKPTRIIQVQVLHL